MEAKLINLNFIFVGFKFTGQFTDYSKLIPQAINEVMQRNEEVKDRSETLIILYEPCKGEDHRVGFFYLGYVVNGEPSSLPEDADVIKIHGKYATATGTISQMVDIYSYIGNWISEQDLKQIWPDSLHIEIYEKRLETEIIGNEKVQVCLSVY